MHIKIETTESYLYSRRYIKDKLKFCIYWKQTVINRNARRSLCVLICKKYLPRKLLLQM